MRDIIDLEAFIPEPQPVTFMDRRGREAKQQIVELKDKLDLAKEVAGENRFRKFLSTKFGNVQRIEDNIRRLTKVMHKHTYKINVSSMSFGGSLYVMKNMDKLRRIMTIKPDEVTSDDFRLLVGLIADITMKTNKKLTADYLYDNLHMNQGSLLLQLAVKSIDDFFRSKLPEAAGNEQEKT
jgi:hypothetical protein